MRVSAPLNGESSHKVSLSSARAPALRIFTSYRFDPHRVFASSEISTKTVSDCHHYLLGHQRDRLQASAKGLDWNDVARMLAGSDGFVWLMKAVQDSLPATSGSENISAQTRKIRISIGQSGTIEVDSTVIDTIPADDPSEDDLMPNDLSSNPTSGRPCKVFVDSESTVPTIFTTHKTNVRTQYDEARMRAEISHIGPNQAEVLIFNPPGEVMEASLSTPYFYRKGRWVTPPLSSGGNAGTTRRFALSTGLCLEEIVRRESLMDGEPVWISNAVRGFVRGSIQKPRGQSEPSAVSLYEVPGTVHG